VAYSQFDTYNVFLPLLFLLLNRTSLLHHCFFVHWKVYKWRMQR